MRNGRPACRPITNPFAMTPLPLVTRRRCSSPASSQGIHITSRSTLDLHELGLCTCAYSVGRVGVNHRTSVVQLLQTYARLTSSDHPVLPSRGGELEIAAGERPKAGDVALPEDIPERIREWAESERT